MEPALQPMHACPQAASDGFGVMSTCVTGDTTGNLVIIAIVAALLAGLCFGVWKWLQSRGG